MNEDTNAILRRLEQLVAALLRIALSESLVQIQADKRLKRLYDLTGVRDVRTIAKKTGYSLGTISHTWQSWEDRGLIVKEGKFYRKLVT